MKRHGLLQPSQVPAAPGDVSGCAGRRNLQHMWVLPFPQGSNQLCVNTDTPQAKSTEIETLKQNHPPPQLQIAILSTPAHEQR